VGYRQKKLAEQERSLREKREDQRTLSLKLTEAQLRGELIPADARQMREHMARPSLKLKRHLLA